MRGQRVCAVHDAPSTHRRRPLLELRQDQSGGRGMERRGGEGSAAGEAAGRVPSKSTLMARAGPAHGHTGAANPHPTRIGRRRCSRGCCKFSGSSGTSGKGSKRLYFDSNVIGQGGNADRYPGVAPGSTEVSMEASEPQTEDPPRVGPEFSGRLVPCRGGCARSGSALASEPLWPWRSEAVQPASHDARGRNQLPVSSRVRGTSRWSAARESSGGRRLIVASVRGTTSWVESCASRTGGAASNAALDPTGAGCSRLSARIVGRQLPPRRRDRRRLAGARVRLP